MTDDFDAFASSAWAEHADQTAAVAQRLATQTHRVQSAPQLTRYAALLVHVYGVHLAQWQRGSELLRTLRGAPGYDGTAASEGPVARGIATLALAAGDASAAEALAPPDRIAALAGASNAVLDRDETDRAIGLFEQALALAEGTPLADDAPAVRSLAVGGNNLAAALEVRAPRSPAQTAAMLRAAQAGLDHWRRCGTWLEHERAEYRAARSQLCAEQAAPALHHAQRCLQICTEHDAPAFERFFGHAAAALAHAAAGDAAAAAAERQRALDAHAKVAQDERAWCDDDLKELHAIGVAAP